MHAEIEFALKAAIALLPALVLLFAYDRLDAFDMVTFGDLCQTLAAGVALSALSYFINGRSLDGLPIGFTSYSRYVSPFVEEALKGGYIAWLIWRGRVGFSVDAAIQGAALGVGFAGFENGYYLLAVPDANVGVWIVRGFGTALMHGGATAVFAVAGHVLNAGRERPAYLRLAPGYVAAALLHAVYNQFPKEPLVAMIGALLLAPTILLIAIGWGARAAERRLEASYDSHAQLLKAFETADGDEAARLLAAIRKRLKSTKTDDVLTYVRLHLSLAAEAEAFMLARERGEPLPKDPDLPGRFAKLHAAERRLGRAARLAVDGHLRFSRADIFELHHLECGADGPLLNRGHDLNAVSR